MYNHVCISSVSPEKPKENEIDCNDDDTDEDADVDAESKPCECDEDSTELISDDDLQSGYVDPQSEEAK